MPYILELNDVTKTFGGIKAVSNLSFNVNKNEIVAIIGPNGAGKTSVFNLITGFYKVDKGDITFENKVITNMETFKIAKMGIARTFQNLRLFKNMTVLENMLAAIYSKNSYSIFAALTKRFGYSQITKQSFEKACMFLDFFKLSNKINNIAGALPYGEQRKLEFARAIATDPKLVLVDEPAAGMNPSEVIDFVDLIHAARTKYDLTILLIEHQMELVMSVSERIIVMDFGEKIMEGVPEEVKKDKRVIDAYLGGE